MNRFSINALTGAIEQDSDLHVQLAFPHPRSVSSCQAEIERLTTGSRTCGHSRRGISFMSSALLTTAQLLKQLEEELASSRRQLLFIAGGPHASGDAAGTLAMGFDVVLLVKVNTHSRLFCTGSQSNAVTSRIFVAWHFLRKRAPGNDVSFAPGDLH